MNIEIEIDDKHIAGLLCSGFEGGVGYWCRIMDYKIPEEIHPVIDTEYVYKYCDYPLLPSGAVICRVIDEEGQTDESYTPLVLDREAIVRGLTLMAKSHPKHVGDFLSGNYDADTGDVFIQLSLLGSIVYG